MRNIKSILVLRSADGLLSMQEWAGPAPDRIRKEIVVRNYRGVNFDKLPEKMGAIEERVYELQDSGRHGLIHFYKEKV